ncbi:hypothetical protein RI129_011392 [Pyrocoelia pectoralis]|uniref:Uncharacterized protein n=1 Tax=Pyrocoelia pectoralis TaxID=417401 RepID=A0AAN7ZHK2_9COLE
MDSVDEIMQLCRLCLVKDEVNIPIFEEQGDLRQIFLKISACLPVKVSKEDNLPKNICDGCSCKLETLYQFWNTSANSEKKLIKWLSQVDKPVSDKHSMNIDPVILKQEVVEVPDDRHSPDDDLVPDDLNVSNDAEDYLIQQQQLPYQNVEFQFQQEEFDQTGTDANVVETGPPSRKRRAAAIRAMANMGSEDEDNPDLLEPKIAKTEEESEESCNEDPEPTTFVGLPSATDNEQPGPSGVGKPAADAPYNENPLSSVERRFENTHVCDVCGRNYDNLIDLQHHVFSNFLDLFVCCKCGKKCPDVRSFHKHTSSHRNLGNGSVLLTSTGKLVDSRIMNMFICKYCDMRFSDRGEFYNHYVSHTGDLPLKRRTAPKRVISVKKFSTIAINTESKRNAALDKLYEFNGIMGNRIRKVKLSTSRRAVTSNLAFAQLKRQYRMKECIVLLGDLKNLNTRVFRPSKKMRQLLIYMKCKTVSVNLKRVKEKVKVKEPDTPPPTDSLNIFGKNYKKQVFKCKQCWEVFEDELKYKRHTTIHLVKRGDTASKQTHSCFICKKSFGSRNLLWMHIRVHSQPQQYKCKDCQESFNASRLLGEHRQQCPKRLESRVDSEPIENNTEVVQKESEANFRYRCSVCLQKFRDVHEMRVHKESHWEKAPSPPVTVTLQCDICDDILEDEESYREHCEFHRELDEDASKMNGCVSPPKSPPPVESASSAFHHDQSDTNGEQSNSEERDGAMLIVDEGQQVLLMNAMSEDEPSNNGDKDAEEHEVLVMTDCDNDEDDDDDEGEEEGNAIVDEVPPKPRIFVRNIKDLMPDNHNSKTVKEKREPITYKCDECNLQFKKRRSYRRHNRLAKAKYKCAYCSYFTCSYTNIRKHYDSSHHITSLCPKCRKPKENDHICVASTVTVPVQL